MKKKKVFFSIFSKFQSDSIARAIRNALDPELQYPQPSIDIFGPSTSNFGNYEENDESILAIVSSTHSSQELSTTTDREKPPKKVKKEKKIGEKFPIFNSKPAHQPIMDDFLSPDDIEVINGIFSIKSRNLR